MELVDWKPEIHHSSEFRQFCNDKWYEHKDELLLYEGSMPKYDAAYFFNQNKWFLKSLFKQQKRG